ncbi:MAG: regulatory signaling modulator protein AmpE [Idiomarina sp.]|nr:regulatory signaling modulator protein AmpE [Idiomarina sp.]
MIVLSLFVALVLERLRITPAGWQLDQSARNYDDWLHTQDAIKSYREHDLLGPLMLLTPAVLLAIVLLFGTGSLSDFLINVVVLTLVLGCRPQREALREWLLAVQREDQQAQLDAEATLLPESDNGITLGQQLLWLNFRFYFSVAFWFVLFGAPGVLGYGLLRACAEREPRLMHCVDWLPVRVAGFAYLLVGHFSRGMPAWVRSLSSFHTPAQEELTAIARDAEEVPENAEDVAEEPQAMMALARRSTILLLAAIALATIFGWIV